MRPGLRITTYRGRATIAYHVRFSTVTIGRVFYAGRHWAALFVDEAEA